MRGSTRANARHHRTLRCRPIDRLIEERAVMAALPASLPDTDRRWVPRVPPDPYLRFDTGDYSLDPTLVGWRVEARVTDREVLAVALDTGEIACRHPRSFAKHRTITALEHARALRATRGHDDVAEATVEIRPGRHSAGSKKTNRRLAKFRVGAEGRISHLKRRYAMPRPRLKGHQGARTWAEAGWVSRRPRIQDRVLEEGDPPISWLVREVPR
jgi:hypothetical protein